MRAATCVAEGILLIRLVCLGSPISITSIIDKHALVYLRLCFVATRLFDVLSRSWSRIAVSPCARRKLQIVATAK